MPTPATAKWTLQARASHRETHGRRVRTMMKHVPKAGAVLMIVALLLVACGSDGGQEDEGGEILTRGEELYQENCISCHGGETGGQISDVPPPHNAAGHTWHHPDCLLVNITLRGPAAWGGEVTPDSMPAFEGILTEEDVMAILAYISTWWTEEQREFQADVTAAQCDA